MTGRSGQAIIYNYDNMPGQIDNTIFVYDSAGQRVKKNNTVYVGKLYECTVVNGICTDAKKHIFTGDKRIATKSSNDTVYFHGDHIGSSSVITNSSGVMVQEVKYAAFGEERYSWGSATNYKFTGQEDDPEIGMYYYGARYYDPALGKFISPDSIVQAPFDPQTLNRYSYVRNNPLVYIDPTGHISIGDIMDGFGDFVDTIGAAIMGLPFGGPLGAVAAAGSNIFLSHTGEGRKLTSIVAKHVFDDMLGLPPDLAYMASNITLTAAVTSGITEGYHAIAGTPKATFVELPKGSADALRESGDLAMEPKGGGVTTGGNNVLETASSKGGRLFAVYRGNDFMGFAASSPAFGLGSVGDFLGIQHTATTLYSDEKLITSMAGLGGGNVYGITSVCHQMTNQTFLSAGLSNTVAGMPNAGLLNYISPMIYGPYGSVNVPLAYYEAEKKY